MYSTVLHLPPYSSMLAASPRQLWPLPPSPLHSRAAAIGIPGNCCLWRHLLYHHQRHQTLLGHHRWVFLRLSHESSPGKALPEGTKRTWLHHSDGGRGGVPGLLLCEMRCSPPSMLLWECSGARCRRGHHVLHIRQVTRSPYFLVAFK